MRARDAIQAAAGILLCVVGFVLARGTSYRETTILVDAGGCRMVTDVVDLGNDETQGSVVLLHGLAANKKIMSYVARGFAEQNLRVFVPDLSGHGRTQGPFSFARAESCSESFVRQLLARHAIDPARTILAGHSMGGAIAVRLAFRISVAGVVAISPAPMSAARGVPADMLPFQNPPAAPANTFVISGSWEPSAVRDTARDLVANGAVATNEYLVIPHATHVSLLFDPEAQRASQRWAAHVLNLAPAAFALPSLQPLAGGVAGFVGLLLLAGPFLRETLGGHTIRKVADDETRASADLPDAMLASQTPSDVRSCLEIAVASVAIVLLLHFWNPLRFIHVFEGDYLAGFLFVLGISLLVSHRKSVSALWPPRFGSVFAAGFAAIALHLLITAWFDLTISEAWLTPARWLRFPALLGAALPYHVAEELLLGPAAARTRKARLALALFFRLIAWSTLVAAIFVLHSGEILLVLLAPYLALLCLLQRWGMDVVRKGTGSGVAAALFGAILLAGLCLVIFPVT